jgi:hypothetical protein
VALILGRALSLVGYREFQCAIRRFVKCNAARGADMFYHVGHQLIDDLTEQNGCVGRHVHTFDIGLDAVWTTISSSNALT